MATRTETAETGPEARDFVLDGLGYNLPLRERLVEGIKGSISRTASAVIGEVTQWPSMVISTARLLKWYEYASFGTIVTLAGGMTAAILLEASEKALKEAPKTPTPAVAAEVRSSQAPTTYIPPSLIASPTPRKP